MSEILYYSNYCNHCKQLLLKLSKTAKRDEMHFICIDKRVKNEDGSIHLLMDNGQRLLLPPNVVKVPSILLLNRGKRVIDGLSEIYSYLSPQEKELNNKATMLNGEPLAFSFSEMGANLSDNYSYLDMTSEELSAKGNGGLRTMHSYTKIQDNQAIETPPDDYEPDKVKESDLGKIEAKRSQDVANINY
jgi:hypothetical protein